MNFYTSSFSFSSYLKLVFIATLSILFSVAVMNYFIDPAGIYTGSNISPDAYAERLITSKSGLAWPEGIFSDRDLAKSLSRHTDKYDCIVIGSSHIMQISSHRQTQSLKNDCTNLINLGVSGASLEDHFTLAYLTYLASSKKKLFPGIDPWTITHGKDKRWIIYRTEYFSARSKILSEVGQESTPEVEPNKLKNLINFEYTIRSLKDLQRILTKGPFKIQEVKAVEEVGIDDPVKLPDGSLIYSSSYLRNASHTDIPEGGSPYGTDGEVSSKEGIREYKKFLTWLQKNDVVPILLMTPYHPNVWRDPDSLNVYAMKKTEAVVLQMAKELGIKVIGSYKPEIFGCNSDEFYDFMHAKAACLARLGERNF